MPLNSRKVLTPIIILAIAILIATGIYLSKPAPKQVEIKKSVLLVNAAEVVKQDIRVSVRAQGMITPRTETTLISEVSGQVIEVSEAFKVGGFFNKGDILLRIDQRDYLAELKRAEAAVASAKSNLASEQGRAEVAYQDWVKYKSSVKRSKAANDLSQRKPQLADAQAKLESSLADLDTARNKLDRTIIRAPYQGLLRTKEIGIGQYVNVGTTLGRTFAVDFAELRLALPENKLNYLELPTLADGDQPLQPRVDLFTEVSDTTHQWQGKIVRTEGVFDDRSRVLFAVAEINDPYGLNNPQQQELRIGTFVEASIEGRLISDLVSLPRHILRAGNQIWVIDQQQRLKNRQVSVLRTEGNQIYITQGLTDGELVCLSAISGATPGTQVRLATVTPTDQSPDTQTVPESPTPGDDQKLDLAPAPDMQIPAQQHTPEADEDQAA